MGNETQAGHTHTTSDNRKNHTRTGTERESRGWGRHINATRKIKSGISNTFKGRMPEDDTVLGTKYENCK